MPSEAAWYIIFFCSSAILTFARCKLMSSPHHDGVIADGTLSYGVTYGLRFPPIRAVSGVLQGNDEYGYED